MSSDKASRCYGCAGRFNPGASRAAEVLCAKCRAIPAEVDDAHGIPRDFEPFRVHGFNSRTRRAS